MSIAILCVVYIFVMSKEGRGGEWQCAPPRLSFIATKLRSNVATAKFRRAFFASHYANMVEFR